MRVILPVEPKYSPEGSQRSNAAIQHAFDKINTNALVPPGGALAAVLTKTSARDWDTQWLAAAPGSITVVSSLPTGSVGQVVYYTVDSTLYRYNGSAWTNLVDTTLLNGTLTTAQIGAGTLLATNFAATIKPIEIVSVLPSVGNQGRTVFLTTDNKLYRDTGVAWIRATDGADITANTITAGKFVAGAIGTTDLAANLITADKLVIGLLGGANLLQNSAFLQGTPTPTGWTSYNNGAISLTYSVATGGLFGTNYARVTTNATATNTIGFYTASSISGGITGGWDPTKTYVMSFWARGGGGFVGRTLSSAFSNSGFTSYVTLENPALTSTFQRYSARLQVTANGGVNPTGEFFISWDLAGGSVASGASFDISAPQIELGSVPTSWGPNINAPGEISTTMISDGAVTTNKLIANAVTAAKIAAGTITANEIAANTITAAKIAAGTITANEIAANTITAAKIAAGTITASQMAANSIITSSLLVTANGAALNQDPNFTDISAWSGFNTPTMVGGITDLTNGGNTAASNAAGAICQMFSSNLIPVDQVKNYRLHATLKESSGTTAINYIAVEWLDATGTHLDSNVAQPTGAGNPAGWPSNGTYSYWGLVAGITPTSWTTYTIAFGPGETAKIPTNARYCRLGALLNYSGVAAAVVQISNYRLEEKVSADLVVDGSITAAKLTVATLSSITANIGTVTAGLVQNSTGSTQFDLTNGKIIFNDGTYMKVTGLGFGVSSKYIEWYGTTQSSATNFVACTDALGLYWIKNDGTYKFGNAQVPVLTHSFSANGTETIPVGYTQCVMELWGPGQSGGHGSGTGCAASGGAGGGGGGYTRSIVSVDGKSGQTITVVCPAGSSGSNASLTGGTFTMTTMTANTGVAASGGSGAATIVGTGGTAAGGTVFNQTGGDGSQADANIAPVGGKGATPITGSYGRGGGGGNGGQGSGGAVGTGNVSIAKFTYT